MPPLKGLFGSLNKPKGTNLRESRETRAVVDAAVRTILDLREGTESYDNIPAYLATVDRKLHNAIAHTLIDRGEPYALTSNFSGFYELQNDVADRLMRIYEDKKESGKKDKKGRRKITPHVYGDIGNYLDRFADPDALADRIFKLKPVEEKDWSGEGTHMRDFDREKVIVLIPLFRTGKTDFIHSLLDSLSETERAAVLAEGVDQIGRVPITRNESEEEDVEKDTLESRIFSLPKRYFTEDFASALLAASGGHGRNAVAKHIAVFDPKLIPKLIEQLSSMSRLPELDTLLELPIAFTQEIALLIAHKEFIEPKDFKKLGVTDPQAVARAMLNGWNGGWAAERLVPRYKEYGFPSYGDCVKMAIENGTMVYLSSIDADFRDGVEYQKEHGPSPGSLYTEEAYTEFKEFKASVDEARGPLREEEYIRVCFGSTLALQDRFASMTLDEVAELFSKELLTEDLAAPFMEGVGIFGGERMFKYLNSFERISRHDMLHAFDKVIRLYQVSGLTPNAFYSQILEGVASDTLAYEHGKAPMYLNEIASAFNPNLEEMRTVASDYNELINAEGFAQRFPDMKAVFASWPNLKKYHELSKELQDAAFLEILKKEQNSKLREYVRELAFHPYSAVDMRAVMEFYQDTGKFLNRDDAHTPAGVHERKKPGNYTCIPYLDLSAHDMRDALVNGDLDEIAAFAPYQAQYIFEQPLSVRLAGALGSQKEKKEGVAKAPKKLFAALQAVLKGTGTSLKEVLAGAVPPPALRDAIEQELANAEYGIPQDAFPAYTLTARVNLKSDPGAVVAGNDTACCMPFASGKNNVYTFNPNCGLLTIQIERSGERPRTIAQSVLTKDLNVGKSVSEMAVALRGSSERVENVLPETVLRSAPSVLSCDSAETAPNFRTPEYMALIQQAYRTFMREYLGTHGRELGLEDDAFLVSTNFADPFIGVPVVDNTFAPRAPVGYSDKLGDTVHYVNVAVPAEKEHYELRGGQRSIPFDERAYLGSEVPSEPVRPLTYQDSLGVAYIESKAYAGNTSVMEYLSQLENTLIAKDINNAHKKRANLSFKYEPDGAMRGYLLAYEGKGQRYGYDGARSGDPLLYVADFAVKEPNSLGGSRAAAELLKAFIASYKKEYLENDVLMPIQARMREGTSYRLMRRQIDAVQESLGIVFEVTEEEPEEQGGENFHTVTLTPKKV